MSVDLKALRALAEAATPDGDYGPYTNRHMQVSVPLEELIALLDEIDRLAGMHGPVDALARVLELEHEVSRLTKENERLRLIEQGVNEMHIFDKYAVLGPGAYAHALKRIQELETERVAFKRHYDAASPEHNLLALLDLYKEREDAALARVAELERVFEIARRVVSRGIHRRNSHQDVALREVTLLQNDIEILAKLADAIAAATKDKEPPP